MESKIFSDRRNFKLYGLIPYARAYFMTENFGNDVRGDCNPTHHSSKGGRCHAGSL